MPPREEFEILASRQLDGELTPAEHARLLAALADPELADWFEDLKRAHEAMAEFAAHNAAPASVSAGVQHSIVGKVHALPRVRWAAWATAAAAVVIGIGLLAFASTMGPAEPPSPPPIAVQPPRQAEIAAFSASPLRVEGAGEAATEASNINRRVSLPATVRAPAGTHAVLRVGAGTAVLKPGTVATLVDVDANGVALIEAVTGDLYLETRKGSLTSRLGEVPVRLQRAGLMLRRKNDAPTAEPVFGTVDVGGQNLKYRQMASISGEEVQITATQNDVLEDWAIEGRLDAVHHELRVLLGDSYEKIPAAFHAYWEQPLRGVMSRPADAAGSAMLLRFFEEHLWLPEWGDVGRQFLRNVADIIGEGTTEADVQPRVREEIDRWKEFARQNPEFGRAAVRKLLERQK